MIAELWKPIPDYEGWYEASNQGRVRSWKNSRFGRLPIPKILSATSDDTGRKRVALWQDNTQKMFLVHRLVMSAFVGDCPDGLEVNHIDGNPSNNRLENLEYVTKSANMRHAVDVLGWKPKGGVGEENSSAKLTEADVIEIRSLYASGSYKKAQLARMYSVSDVLVSKIIKRQIWRHVA